LLSSFLHSPAWLNFVNTYYRQINHNLNRLWAHRSLEYAKNKEKKKKEEEKEEEEKRATFTDQS
jgi:hypothetical protein